MGWVKLDDHILDNPKILGLSDRAILLYIASLTHCAAHLTDGFVSTAAARHLAYKVVQNAAEEEESTDSAQRLQALCGHVKRALTRANLWESVEGGYHVHDYLVYNPSRADVMQQRKQDRERKSRWRAQGWDKSRRDSRQDHSASGRDSPRDSDRDLNGRPGATRRVSPPGTSTRDSASRGVSPTEKHPPTPPPASSRAAGGPGPVPAGDDQGDELPEPDFEAGKAHLAKLREQVGQEPPRGLKRGLRMPPPAESEPLPEPPESDPTEEPF